MLSGEKTILQRAQRGDTDAFEQVYDFYVPKIFRFAFLKIGNKENAEDLTSETFIRFWTVIRKEKITAESAEPILYKIARNLIIDFYRKKEIIAQEIDEELANTISDKQSDFISRMINREEIKEMMEILREIKDEYQEIIILRFVEELEIEEVAQITGKTKGSVRVLSHRALKSLEKVMKMKENKII
ncbi:MAG: RNA polymerase sigma factor [Candidatus Pacebacteria bacterium]|jgi:RNA polymerase sigma-70 factor (ECF subfamily)|nr:RNA polymerase sigma factor [Candidatus Paceibacterota bacterium]